MPADRTATRPSEDLRDKRREQAAGQRQAHGLLQAGEMWGEPPCGRKLREPLLKPVPGAGGREGKQACL